jgi:hypothetical protein
MVASTLIGVSPFFRQRIGPATLACEYCIVSKMGCQEAKPVRRRPKNPSSILPEKERPENAPRVFIVRTSRIFCALFARYCSDFLRATGLTYLFSPAILNSVEVTVVAVGWTLAFSHLLV